MRLIFILIISGYAACAFGQTKQPEKLFLEKRLKQAMPDTARVHLLVQLSAWFIHKPGEDKKDLDSAKLLLDEAAGISQKLHFDKGLGMVDVFRSQAYREGGDADAGKKYAQQALAVFNKLPPTFEKAEALMEMANYYRIEYDSQLAEKVRLYTEAMPLMARHGEPIKYADALKFLGDLHNCQNRPDIAYGELKKALAIYQANGHTALQDIYNLLGYVCNRLGLAKDALSYGLSSVRLAESERDSSMTLCAIYNRLALTYRNLGDPASSSSYLKKALQLARKHKAQDAEFVISVNLAEEYRTLGQSQKAIPLLKPLLKNCPPHWDEARLSILTALIGAYGQLKQLETAAYYNGQMQALLVKGTFRPSAQFSAHSAAVYHYMALKDFTNARQHIRANEELAEKSGEVILRSQVEKMYYRTDSAAGNFVSALKHYQRLKMWDDSVSRRTKAFQVSQLQIAYDTEKKDKDISLKAKNIELLTRTGQIRETQLQKANISRNAVIGGILLLGVLLGVVYNRFKLKKRANLQLEARQRVIDSKNQALELLITDKDRLLQDKEWLLKEIHHRVENNLQIVISLLNTQCAQLESAVAMAAIQESQHRMRSISLIHEKLYQSDDVSEIDMFAYISQLVDYLSESFDITGRIKVELLVEPMELDAAQAVPIGLILNEAITNCIKYAFVHCNKGKIKIGLDEEPDGKCLLTISDNGCGLPAGFDVARPGSLGMSLMHGLTLQLGGELLVFSDGGLVIQVSFRKRSVPQSEITELTYAN